jgi:4-hydroxy-2-oxoheptanedioate aldolase
MIESRRGLDNLAEILAVDGIDAVILGEADLAASLGHLGNPAHPDVTAAVDLVARGCRDAGVPYGMYAATAGRARALFEQGASFVTVGSDLLFLEQRMGQVLEEFGGLRAAPLATAPQPTPATEEQP